MNTKHKPMNVTLSHSRPVIACDITRHAHLTSMNVLSSFVTVVDFFSSLCYAMRIAHFVSTLNGHSSKSNAELVRWQCQLVSLHR